MFLRHRHVEKKTQGGRVTRDADVSGSSVADEHVVAVAVVKLSTVERLEVMADQLALGLD